MSDAVFNPFVKRMYRPVTNVSTGFCDLHCFIHQEGDTVSKKYSIPGMEDALENATSVVLGEIKHQFHSYLENLNSSGLTFEALSKNSQVAVCNVSDHKSLSAIYSLQGFYIICTDHNIQGNKCNFILEDKYTAIYRGECSSVRRRVESHIFNSIYRNLYETRKNNKLSQGGKFSEPYYGACMKVDPSISGINIDEAPYCQSNWSVVVLKMPYSSSIVRKQAELAFDYLFGKPVASRE